MESLNSYLKKIFIALKLPLAFIGLITSIQIVDSIFFQQTLGLMFGIIPRTSNGLLGILVAPFLHGSYEHLIGNSIMILLLSWIICFYDTRLWFKTLFIGTILGGIFTWTFGLNASHFGASGFVFALWGAIIGLAIFHKKPFFIIASLVLFSTYGLGFILGLIPQPHISFVGHLGGLLAGFASVKQLRYTKGKE